MPEENTNVLDEVFEIMSPEDLAEFSDEELQEAVLDLEHLKLEVINPFYENQKNVINEILRRKGVNYMFQDEETGAVLKLDVKEYTAVSLFPYYIARTRFSDDEPKQSLSNKEAEEKGFVLKLGDRRKKKS